MEVNGAHEQAEDGHVSHKSKFPTGPRVNSVEKIYGVLSSFFCCTPGITVLVSTFGNPSHHLSCYALATSLRNGLNQELGLIWK